MCYCRNQKKDILTEIGPTEKMKVRDKQWGGRVLFKNTGNEDIFKSHSCFLSVLRAVAFKGCGCDMHSVMHGEECFTAYVMEMVMSALWMLLGGECYFREWMW